MPQPSTTTFYERINIDFSRLDSLREDLQRAQPEDLPPQTRPASESLQRLLTDLEARDGILDRRFYAVCGFGRIDDLRGLLARAGLSVYPLRGRQLRMFFVAAALGGSPSELDEEAPVEVEISLRDMRIGGSLVRSLHLGKWPRSLAPGFSTKPKAIAPPISAKIMNGQDHRTMSRLSCNKCSNPVATSAIGRTINSATVARATTARTGGLPSGTGIGRGRSPSWT